MFHMYAYSFNYNFKNITLCLTKNQCNKNRNIDLGNSMATSVRSGIKLEGSASTGSQISTITVVTAGGVGQTLVVQPVQQASVVRTSIDQIVNGY